MSASGVEAALAALAAGDHPAALRAFEAVSASLRDPRHLLYLGNLRKEAGDLPGAAEAWRAAVALDPDHLPGRMNLAAAARASGDLSAARGLYLDVLQRNPDHRRAVILLGEVLIAGGERAGADQLFALAHRRGALADPRQRALDHQPGLRAHPWWDPADVPGADALIAVAAAARQELEAVLESAEVFGAWNTPLLIAGQWKKLFFARRGEINRRALRACPAIADALRRVPGALGVKQGNCCFSAMEPGSRIHAHCGPTNRRLRLHLGLIVPDGCALTVGGEERPWREGELLAFDDSFEHNVRHDGSMTRIVLIVDVPHPDLSI